MRIGIINAAAYFFWLETEERSPRSLIAQLEGGADFAELARNLKPALLAPMRRTSRVGSAQAAWCLNLRAAGD